MKPFFDSINSTGGNMIVCLLVIVTGAVFYRLGIPKAEELIMGGSGALFMAMRPGTSPVPAPVTPKAP